MNQSSTNRRTISSDELRLEIEFAKEAEFPKSLSDYCFDRAVCMTEDWLSEPRDWSKIPFENCRFQGMFFPRADLDEAEFESCEFNHTQFLKNASLAGAKFRHCVFRNSEFSEASLDDATFESCEFLDTEFSEASLGDATFDCCEFNDTEFSKANLDDATFESCEFSGVRLCKASLDGTDFIGCEKLDVEFRRSDLSSGAFYDCDLQNVDFRMARLHRTRLSSQSIRDRHSPKSGKFRIRQERNAEWDKAAEVYLILKENFASLANHEDASWAHFKEMQMRRRSQGGLRQWLSEYIWGYGEKPERPFCLGVFLILAGTLFAWLLDAKWGGLAGASSLGDYLLFSAASFVLASFPGLEAEHIGVQLLAIIEGSLGVVTLSMFTFAIAERISGK